MAGIQSGVAIPKAYAQQAVLSPIKPVGNLTAENIAALRALDESFSNLSEFAKPAVVHIRSESGRATSTEGVRQPTRGGQGSGFIFRPDGYIITNDHVVGGFDRVTVILSDGREFPGKVIRATDSDIALVKINAKDLPTLQFADSKSVRVGQHSIAIGSPFGLENSVTIGHVSAIGRQDAIPDQENPGVIRQYPDLIQTDASINMGNSGGPLINVDGQVIGINTAIFSSTGGSVGIGFAIPANQARMIANKLITDGKLTRSMLGLVPVDLKPFEKTERKVAGGALVENVQSDGPAEAAGIRKGDLITRIGDREVETQLDLRNAMLEYRPGTTVKVEFLRDGKKQSAQVKLVEFKQPVTQVMPRTRRESPLDGLPFELFKNPKPDDSNGDKEPPVREGQARLGVTVESITADLRKEYGIPAEVKGAVVASVQPGSVADNLGIKAGTVIDRLGDQTIASAEDLTNAMKSVKWGDQRVISFQQFGNGSNVKVQRTVKFR